MKLLQWVGASSRQREIDVELVGRNVLINGGFDVWQRGGGAFTGVPQYTADQWVLNASFDTVSLTRQSQVFGAIPGLETQFFCRTVVTAVANASAFVNLFQLVEGVRTLAGQTATVSFWAKASVAKSIALSLSQAFGGPGGSPSGNVNTTLGVAALTTAWQRFNFTFAVPSIAGKTIGAGASDSLNLIFWLDSGSGQALAQGIGQLSATVDIAGVQIEAGKNATSFEQQTYGDVLDSCQRYLQIYADLPLRGVVSAIKTPDRMAASLVAQMRAVPTVSIVGSVGFYDGGTGLAGAATISGSFNTGTSVELNFSAPSSASWVLGRAMLVYGGVGSVWTVTAEL